MRCPKAGVRSEKHNQLYEADEADKGVKWLRPPPLMWRAGCARERGETTLSPGLSLIRPLQLFLSTQGFRHAICYSMYVFNPVAPFLMETFPLSLPVVLITLSKNDPLAVAKFLRDFADDLTALALSGEKPVAYTRGGNYETAGGTARIQWGRTFEEDEQIFRALHEKGGLKGLKPYGKTVEIGDMVFSEVQVRTIPVE